MFNATVTKMLESFDNITLLQKDYNLGEIKEEHLRKLVAGIRHYQKYVEKTGGIFELNKVTPLNQCKPNPRPFTYRDEAINNPSSGEHSLSEKEINAFCKDGIIGPFDVITPEEANDLHQQSYNMHENEFANNFVLGDDIRDQLKENDNWTLNYAGVWQALNIKEYRDLLSRNEITDRLGSLMGNDIMCWRSQLFEVKPQQAGTFWHQASTFKESSKAEKLVFPNNIDPRMGQLTAWIALQDVDTTNGCLQFVPGSQAHDCCEKLSYEFINNIGYSLKDKKDDQEIYDCLKSLVYAPNIFHKAFYVFHQLTEKMQWLFDGLEVKPYPMKAGQGIIFSSMVSHASYGNNTNANRLAIGGRYTTPETKVYDGFKTDLVPTKAGNLEFPIDKIASFMVRGEDKFHYNKMAPYEFEPKTFEDSFLIKKPTVCLH